MNPKISVLITAYNSEKYIKKAIESVLGQTFKDFELIIVDDGSTDGTKKIIKKYEKKDSRIKYFYYGKNKGFYNLHNVINIGLEKCKGEYIARLDADDICHPKRLELQSNYLDKHSKIFMIGSSAEVIDKNGKKIGAMKKKPWPPWLIKLMIAYNNPFIHSSIMFRNERLEYPSYSEVVFYFDCLIKGKKIRNLVEPLVKYRINPEGVMATYSKLKGGKYDFIWKSKNKD